MSESAYIDSTKGPHAAAELTDQQVEWLCKLVLWEVGMRTSKEQYTDYLVRLIELRHVHDDEIGQAKHERDQYRFKASVLADLESLPVAAHVRPIDTP